MTFDRVLVANRGEVTVRILRAAAELDLTGVAVFAADDEDGLHVQLADRAVALPGKGPAAYLDAAALIAAAESSGCQAIHPGYGFLAEDAGFARACEQAGLVWIGPAAHTLELLGDKARARGLAESLDVPVLPATKPIRSLADATTFMAGLEPGSSVMVKAVAGGGGRGLRVVHHPGDLADAIERSRSEARQAFGRGEIFVEKLLPRARHIEVQILGDGSGRVAVLGDRDCSVQRRRQKLVEIAPAPKLSEHTRKALTDAARTLAAEVRYRGLATIEFLVDAGSGSAEPDFFFLEVNPRLQVEHTVTEEVTGIDLVRAQLRVAAGAGIADLGLDGEPLRLPRGFAVQVRINAESLSSDGTAVPQVGELTVYQPPGGPGVRVDGCGYVGYRVTGRYDSLLAKLIARDSSPHIGDALLRVRRALQEFRIEGVGTNRALLSALLARPEIAAGSVHTRYLDEILPELVPADSTGDASADQRAGVAAVTAAIPATVVAIACTPGDSVAEGETLLVLEAMKMEHLVTAPVGGIVQQLLVRAGEVVSAGQPLAQLAPGDVEATDQALDQHVDLDLPRPDLAELLKRRSYTEDSARAEAVARRHASGRSTARENIADLCDDGSFVEYGALAIAAQRRRRPLRELIERTPADGLVAGIGTVNGAEFGEDRARTIAMSYDYLVLAGTQGHFAHAKKDRMFTLAEQARLPIVLFAEGGGGRPGDTDGAEVTALDCMAFALYARLSGVVPLVGIASGRCFAGNAALLGCSDVIIATPEASIGMGGPAMIEGGGLGVFGPDEIGPAAVHRANGVIDLMADDDADAVALARKYLSYFQGRVDHGEEPDQRELRHVIPENRVRVYDIRRVLTGLADIGTVLELRRDFGRGVVTALARVDGKPLGVLANDPAHLGGAIDSDAADKAARFLQLCDAFGLPVISLVDTPGFMVGPDSERTAAVRHVSRIFVTAASLTVPYGAIVLRKGYGLGAQAMAAGGFHMPRFVVSWPTGEFGPMGLEGAVRLGYRRELEAIEDPGERQQTFEQMVAAAYEHGKATNVASAFEIDDVIDPAESRRWIRTLLNGGEPPSGGRRRCIDTW